MKFCVTCQFSLDFYNFLLKVSQNDFFTSDGVCMYLKLVLNLKFVFV